MVVLAQELRSALFWAYIVTDHADQLMLVTSAKLLGAITGGDPVEIRKADAALSQGVNYLRQGPLPKR